MDDGTFPYSGSFHLRLIPRGNFRPHPALIAYATLIRQLYGATYQGRFNTLQSVYAFRFQRGREQFRSVGKPLSSRGFALGQLYCSVTNIMGGTETKSPVSGKVLITLSKDVQYVVGSVSAVAEIDNDLLADSVSGYSKTAGENGWHYGYADPTDPYDPAQFKPMTWGIWGGDNYRWLTPGGYPFGQAVKCIHPDLGQSGGG